jgi:DNA mismatch repair protein MSH5
VGCAGAVLNDVKCRREALMLSQDLEVSSIQMFTLSDYMFVNSDTLVSLQILRSELHPNSQAWGPKVASKGAKESLSVFGLFHQYACSPQGKTRLRQMFLRPSTDVSVIRQRQHAISVLIRPENAAILATLRCSLRKIQNIRRSIENLQKGADAGHGKASTARNVWVTLQRFSAYSTRIRECLTRLGAKEKVVIIEEVGDDNLGSHVWRQAQTHLLSRSCREFPPTT